MIIFVYALIAVMAFCLGFLFGKSKEVKLKNIKNITPHKATVSLIREYENFLNYDGSEQTK